MSVASSFHEQDKPEVITIILELNGQMTHFKVKRSTPMSKISNSFAKVKGVAPGSFKLCFDGDRVRADDTPDTLGMEDNDVMCVLLPQEGGSN